MALSQITLLDASRRWFDHVAKSPNFTREARRKALEPSRSCEAELGVIAAKAAGHNPGGSSCGNSGAPLALVA